MSNLSKGPLMEDSHIVSFVAWCAITSIIIIITGLSYKSYLRKTKNENSSS